MAEYKVEFDSMDDAKAAALQANTRNLVCAVFKELDSGMFGWFHYPENRYLFLHVPDGCEIVSVYDWGQWTDNRRMPSEEMLAAGFPEIGAAFDDILLSDELLPTEQTKAPPKGG